MKKTPLFPFLPPDLSESVQQSALTYRGYAPTVADAMGALVFGQLYGWRGVMMLYSRQRLKEFDKALGIRLKEHMPDRTPESAKILGVDFADKIGKFWAVVKAEIAVPGGKAFIDDEGQGDMFRGGADGRASQ